MPYPTKVVFDQAGRRPRVAADSLVPLMFSIDTTGHVTGIEPVRPEDTTILSPFLPSLRSALFQPGLINGVVASCLLPARLIVRPSRRLPVVEWPVDRKCTVNDADLYFYALEKNGILLPRLKSFPSYYSDVKSTDSLRLPPVILAEIDLDTTGRPVRISPVLTTRPAQTGPILSAMNWAEYVPARREGKVIPGSGLLAIFLYPDIVYPVPQLDLTNMDTANQFHQTRVRFFPVREGFLLPAIPRNLRNGYFSPNGYSGFFQGKISALLSVDTLGQVRLAVSGRWTGSLVESCQSILRQVKFYPALDFDGRPVRFRGRVFLEFDGSKTVRIRCPWLGPGILSSSS